jgi:TPR repeat protein
MYQQGQGVPKDEAEAARLFRKAADRDHPVAMYNLALLYEEGRGVPKDEAEAVRLYRQAAGLGEPDAINNLGRMYALGKGVPKDRTEALRLFREAAGLGSALAKKNLARHQSQGVRFLLVLAWIVLIAMKFFQFSETPILDLAWVALAVITAVYNYQR